MPEHYPKGGVAHRIWRGLECLARGTLLVHGSKAIAYLKNCGTSTDPKDVISKMVEEGVLVPCKVDIPGTDRMTLQFKNVRHIEQSAWCTDFALCWTYEPGNRTPMREDAA